MIIRINYTIMNKRILFTIISIVAFIAGSFTASAFPATKYTNLSKLASGNWVKIAIPADGMYQITYNELKEMGFTNPQSVRIYGSGGNAISELLNGTAIDDLVQIPCKTGNDKIYFYGRGPVRYPIETPTTTPHYTRYFNSYSTMGYYFITSDENTPLKEPTNVSYQITGTKVRSTSLDYYHHEQDIVSPSQSGKEMLGELLIDGSINIPYSIFGLCPDSAMVITPYMAAKCANPTNVSAKVNDEPIDLNIGSNKIHGSSTEYTFYNYAYPSGIYRNEAGIPSNGTITAGVVGDMRWARLNYILLTFYHHNSIIGSADNQLRMGFNKVTSADIIAVSNATSTTQMWNIDNPNEPKNYTLNEYSTDLKGFTPNYTADYSQFITFDPSKPLKSIAGFEPVENQNIHGMPTPDMVIVTCKPLLPQAERIANMHRVNDNMIVHVLDQQNIFNEFSSGTPDAMGIRLMCKMFYDRDKDKFKNLLMFGAGSYDNRQILTKRDCAILTYESNTSHDENNSYVSDDFFGMLDDNSGTNVTADLLRIGVGRIPCNSVEEAEGDVNKLLNYVNNPDYGPWRNNILLVADYFADDKHTHSYQAEGIGNIITDSLSIDVMKNKVYVTQFPTDPISGYCYEGRKSMNTQLKSGQYFMTYVGHANANSLTKEVKLWTTNESKKATYPHLPIITTACCDVARYDGNQRGLMEIMFHKPDGGAIAMLAATRAAYSNWNDVLNQAFVRAAFCYNTKGYMPTLGEAYMLSKNAFGTGTNYNKMMFSLLGDPAMKLNYPKPYFKITSINGQAVGTDIISTAALRQVTVVAKVYTPDGSQVDYSFNGDATLSIYDLLKKERTYNSRDIYFPRKEIAQISGRVVNGVFTGKVVIPRHTLNPGNDGLVSVYAHRDNSDEMVNGSFDKLRINAYNASSSQTIHDDTPPSIEAIYFNDEQDFDLCNQVGTNATLHIHATDDYSFNNQEASIGNSMDLKLDGGKTSIPDVKVYATMSNNGKTLDIALPMTLEPGDHTLHYTVYDAAGNVATRTINFAVGTQLLDIMVEQEPAINEATFNITTNLPTIPEVDIKVFNHTGTLRWQTTTSTFPFNWDLIGSNGKRIPAGIYTFYGKYKNGTNYGGTSIGTLIVADDHKSK